VVCARHHRRFSTTGAKRQSSNGSSSSSNSNAPGGARFATAAALAVGSMGSAAFCGLHRSLGLPTVRCHFPVALQDALLKAVEIWDPLHALYIDCRSIDDAAKGSRATAGSLGTSGGCSSHRCDETPNAHKSTPCPQPDTLDLRDFLSVAIIVFLLLLANGVTLMSCPPDTAFADEMASEALAGARSIVKEVWLNPRRHAAHHFVPSTTHSKHGREKAKCSRET